MTFTGDPADAIAREEARVASLEAELKESRAALASLRAKLGRAAIPSDSTRVCSLGTSTRDLLGESGLVPLDVPGPRGRISEALDQREDGSQRVRPCLCERVGPRRLREASGQVR